MSNNLNILFELVKLPNASLEGYLEKMRDFTKINLTNSKASVIEKSCKVINFCNTPPHSELPYSELFQNGQNNGIYFISKRSCP